MGQSIMQEEKCCYLCGKVVGLERHHVLGGFSSKNRQRSEAYGLWVWLCHECHTGVNGAQYDKQKNWDLKVQAQKAFEALYGHDLWMRTFYKNYVF